MESKGESFTFDMGAKRKKHSDEAILEQLREFGEEVGGRAFLMTEFESWRGRRVGMSTILSRFGSWRGALSRVGLTGGKVRAYTPAELVERIEHAWKVLGWRPGHHSLMRISKVSTFPYKRHWGSLRSACERVAAFHAGEISREELLRRVPEHERKMRARRKGIPVDVRWRVLKRDGHRCVSCGASPARDASVELQIDHVVPVSKGGGNEEGNLRVLCRGCNAGKRDELPSA